MPNLLEQLHARQRDRRADAEARYRAAVREAAEGKELDPDDVLEVLVELNRDAAQFAADTGIVAQRMELRAKLESAPALRELVAKLEREAATEAEAFKPLAVAHRNKMNLLLHRIQTAKQDWYAAEGAARELYESCRDPELLARAEALRGEAADLERARWQRKRALDTNRAQLEGVVQKAQKFSNGFYDDDIQSARNVVANDEKKLAEISAAIARNQAASATNEEAMRRV